jgi:hypothetical protein
MNTKGLTPILNVSDFKASVERFEKLGWECSSGECRQPRGEDTK